ncbi:MAG: heavy metal-binding domain-containing protein, partial [Bacteroidales bacterium]
KKEAAVKTVYTCPMHAEIVQDKAGKCPKCGMDLIAKEVKKDVYTCPMHSEVVQDKPGKCPKCGMNLALKEPVKKADPPKK